jgi:hypothetical protein
VLKKRDSVWLLVLVLIRVSAAAQDTRRNREPYLIPPVVYVGDRAALVIPLAGDGAAKDLVISFDAQHIPHSPDIDFHRVAMEWRPSGGRLMIEFAAFVPGVLELPPIEIGGERFAGLRVEISSILGSGESGAVLSGPAPPLAVPGASFLVYGTMSGFVLFLLLALWLGVWGRRRFKGWISRWKRRRLIVSMWGVEKRLRRVLLKEGRHRDILNSLSREFRSFLSFFTGENCRAMTAAELGRLSPELLAVERGGAQESGVFLGTFFRRCDELRFSGSDIAAGDVLGMLGDLRRFLKNLDRAERGKSLVQDEAA